MKIHKFWRQCQEIWTLYGNVSVLIFRRLQLLYAEMNDGDLFYERKCTNWFTVIEACSLTAQQVYIEIRQFKYKRHNKLDKMDLSQNR